MEGSKWDNLNDDDDDDWRFRKQLFKVSSGIGKKNIASEDIVKTDRL